MKANVYCIKNELTGGYEGLFLFRNPSVAARMLGQQAQRNNMNLNDIQLYEIGEFDMDSGSLTVGDKILCPLMVKEPIENKMNPVEDSRLDN